MRIELVQTTCQDCNIEANLASVLQAIHCATSQSKLLVFPELYLSGFPTKATIGQVACSLDSQPVQTLLAACRQSGKSLAIGLSESASDGVFNTTILLTPDGQIHAYRKTHLWASDRDTFRPGDRYTTWLWQGLRVGLLICYDIEFPESARALGQLGVDVLIVTNGNMDPYGPVHRRAIQARAMENQCFAVMVNRCGQGDGLTFAGGSCVVDPFGEMIVEAGRDAMQLAVDLPMERLLAARKDYDYLQERRFRLPGREIVRDDESRELLIQER